MILALRLVAAEPKLVRDLNAYGSYPAEIVAAGEKLFFASRDLAHGDELWCYDGVRSALVSDLRAGIEDFAPTDLAVAGSQVFFRSSSAGQEHELWRSDGTASGTQRIFTFPGERARIEGMQSDGRLLFVRVISSDPQTSIHFDLWVSDGTPGGTRRLPVNAVDSFGATRPVATGDRFYFTCSFGHELWSTNGTAEGTVRILETTMPCRSDLVALSNGLVFGCWDALWVTDGSISGTRTVNRSESGAAISFPYNPIPLGKQLVFFAHNEAQGFEPWITDGTRAGTSLLGDFAPGSADGMAENALDFTVGEPLPIHASLPETVGAAGDRAYFTNRTETDGWELWSTNGTRSGTGRLVDLLPGPLSSAPQHFTRLNGRILFVATGDESSGRELWISDGTVAGTRLLADLAAGSEESRPVAFTPYKDGLAFRAFDGEGSKLWFTDGTPAGTRILDPRFSNSHDGSYSKLTASGNRLFFNFSDDDGASVFLGASDGTAAGTHRVLGPIPTSTDPNAVSWTAYSLFPLGNGQTLWTPWVEGLGTELWFSEGTTAGTGLLHDFSAETGSEASSPVGFVRLADEVYFSAFVGNNVREYFKLNLRTLGVTTAQLGNSIKAVGGYAYAAPQGAGGMLFVNSITGRRPPFDWQVFMSRPGEPPVQLQGLDEDGAYRHAESFVTYRGFTYFAVTQAGTPTVDLWRNNGTAAGTARFASAPNGRPLAVVNNRLLIAHEDSILSTDGNEAAPTPLGIASGATLLAADATAAFFMTRGSESVAPSLWVTDATPTGTRRVFSFETGALNETLTGVLVQGTLLFRAKTDATGHELWRSDGTTEGTWMVADLWPGSGSGATHEMAALPDGRFFFVGRHPRYGAEIFEAPPEAVAAGRPAAALPLLGHSANAGASLTLTAQVSGTPAPVVGWWRNGHPLASATNPTLALPNLRPEHTGIYHMVAENSVGRASTRLAIVGLESPQKVIGPGEPWIVENILHPNGNIFDQVLLTGAAESITADYQERQITRTSFVDIDDDIVQVEFSGPGTLSLVLESPSGPMRAVNYNQPDIAYMKGHAGIVISGATEETNISVFTVGRATAFNQTLFQAETKYDGIADLAFIAILSANGKFGGVRTANANYFASQGITGLYAPGVEFHGPVYLGDISAFHGATPTIVLRAAKADTWITGGDLLQDNGKPVQISGVARLQFKAGSDSHGRALPSQTNRAIFIDDGVDVTTSVVVNPSNP